MVVNGRIFQKCLQKFTVQVMIITSSIFKKKNTIAFCEHTAIRNYFEVYIYRLVLNSLVQKFFFIQVTVWDIVYCRGELATAAVKFHEVRDLNLLENGAVKMTAYLS